MKGFLKGPILLGLLCWGLIYAGYIVGKIRTENRVTKNLESLYAHVDQTMPMSDFRRYTRLGAVAEAIDWATNGAPEEAHP